MTSSVSMGRRSASEPSAATEMPLSARTVAPPGVSTMMSYAGSAPSSDAARSTSLGPARSSSWNPSKATIATRCTGPRSHAGEVAAMTGD
jgi:hypothetical protein